MAIPGRPASRSTNSSAGWLPLASAPGPLSRLEDSAICFPSSWSAPVSTCLTVPATVASRVQVLGTGKSDTNDPNDARSVAIAALRSPGLRSVQAAANRLRGSADRA